MPYWNSISNDKFIIFNDISRKMLTNSRYMLYFFKKNKIETITPYKMRR